MLTDSTRTHCLLNLAHLREVAALYGPEEAKKVAAVFKTISLLSSFSAKFSADTLDALVKALARKNLNGNSAAQILTMTSNEFATLAVGAVSKDEKRRLKQSLNAIVASKCDFQADVYPMWLAAREMRKIDAAASQGDLLRALYDATGDVDARIVDALVTNEFTRYFIIRLLRLDDEARDAESVAEALKSAVAGFIAGLPHFFEAAAVPEAAAHPPITAAAPISSAAAISAQPPITAAPTSDGTIASSTSGMLVALESVKKETVDAVESVRSAVLSAIDAMAQSAHLDREAARLDREAARDSARLDREYNTANLTLAIHALRPVAAHGPSVASASRANTQPSTPRQAAGVCTFARPTQCACRQALACIRPLTTRSVAGRA